MNDKRIENYLRKSTRGLWGRKRLEIREELSAHIDGRVNSHLIAGLRETDAIEKTLIELGHPMNVSTGMARLYTLPVVAGSGMMLAMCCAVVVVLLSGSTAQTLNTVNVIPADECLEPQGALPTYCETYDNFTTLESLKETLEKQGVAVGSVGYNWTLKFPNGSIAVVPAIGSQMWTMDDDEKTITLHTRPEYLSVRDLITSLAKLKSTSVQLEGWETPTVYVGETSFQISGASQEGGTSKFYLQQLWDSILSKNIKFFSTTSQTAVMLGNEDIEAESKRFQLGAKSDAVYGIAIVLNPEAPFGVKPKNVYDLAFYTNVSVSNEDGYVDFQMQIPEKGLTFKSDVAELSNDGDAVIVKLTGVLRDQMYSIIPPDQITLE
jgi:hypothetical protein